MENAGGAFLYFARARLTEIAADEPAAIGAPMQSPRGSQRLALADADSKRRGEWMLVWQLTEHATDTDRNAVIVSLNFEPDFKQDWPEYVKARTVYERWQGLVALEPRGNPTLSRQRTLKRDIARTFAISADDVSRYIGMVELAEDFEDYHVTERNQDQYAVKPALVHWR